MLYLPAFEFEGIELRLPARAESIVELCRRLNNADDSISLLELFAGDPGIFLFVVARCSALQSGPILSLEQVFESLSVAVLSSNIDDDAFSPIANLDSLRWDVFYKWLQKPRMKSLKKFVQSFSDLDGHLVRQGLKNILSKEFEFASLQSNVPKENPNSYFANSPLLLPVRLIWEMQRRIHALESDFERRLHDSKMEAMKQLAYGASHEINNPLANIASRAQVLMSREDDGGRRQQLATIYSQAIRAHEMISDLMLFANPPEAEFRSADLRELAQSVIGELATEAGAAEISMRVCQYPDVCNCDIDWTQIAEALKAMLQNSMIAIGVGGEIRVQIWREDQQHIGIGVCDTGDGVDTTIADLIFDPFYSSREAGRGLGFGLSKAWRIAELHKGRLRLAPSADCGGRFVMTLPIKRATGENKQCRIDNLRAA